MGFEKLAELKQQLASAAKPKKLEAEPESTPVNPVIRDIARLQKLFPKAFPKNPLPKVPLKKGTLDDLISRSAEIGLSGDKLKSALNTWCLTKRYWASVKAGVQRLDLDGNPSGEVQIHEAVHANYQLKKLRNSAQ